MLPIVKADGLKLNNKVVCGISTRFFGSLQYNHNREEVLKNRQLFFRELGIAGRGSLARVSLVHGNRIYRVTAEDLKNDNRIWQEIKIKNCDGLLTDQRQIWLAITIADCVPIFLWDDQSRVVGVIHAGWRSTLIEICRRAVEQIKEEFEIGPRKLNAFIGPSIGSCCFEVQDDIWSSFKKRFPTFKIFIERDKKKYLDLKEANLRQLTGAGMLKKKIEVSTICTVCQQKRFFTRRGGDSIQAQMALIGLRS